MDSVRGMDEFQKWLDRTCDDAAKKLRLSDISIAFLLLTKGLSHYVKAIAKGQVRP